MCQGLLLCREIAAYSALICQARVLNMVVVINMKRMFPILAAVILFFGIASAENIYVRLDGKWIETDAYSAVWKVLNRSFIASPTQKIWKNGLTALRAS